MQPITKPPLPAVEARSSEAVSSVSTPTSQITVLTIVSTIGIRGVPTPQDNCDNKSDNATLAPSPSQAATTMCASSPKHRTASLSQHESALPPVTSTSSISPSVPNHTLGKNMGIIPASLHAHVLPVQAPPPLYKKRLPRRRDSAEVRARVLTRERHRRLLPLSETEKSKDNKKIHSITPSALHSATESVMALSAPSTLGRRGNMNNSASRAEGASHKETLGTSTQGQAWLPSLPRPNMTTAPDSLLALHTVDKTPELSSGQFSSDSSLFSSAAVLLGEDASTSASLTSLQQRLWDRTEGAHIVVPTTGEHGHVLPSMSRGQGRSTAMALVSAARLAASSPAAASKAEVKPAITPADHTVLTVPVAQWRQSLDKERICGEQGRHVAHALIKRLVNTTTSVEPFRSLLSGGGEAFDLFDHFNSNVYEVEGGSSLIRSLCERAAVAAFLLSTLLDDLPRHQQSLRPFVQMLLDFTFVSDTPVHRAILGGSIQDKALLSTLGVDPADAASHASCAATSASMSLPEIIKRESTQRQGEEVHSGSSSFSLLCDGDCTMKGLRQLLYPNFTRMTCVAAHYEAAYATVDMAYSVRTSELQQRNMRRLLHCTHRHWMHGLMRVVLLAWQRMCTERRKQLQVQRARWTERWTNERGRIAIRRWVGYAKQTLYAVAAANLALTLLAEKRANIERLEKESDAMQTTSTLLQETLQRQEEEREVLEKSIVERERVYKRLLRHVREIDRVGSLMLNSLLLPVAPPVPYDADAMNGFTAAMRSSAGEEEVEPSVDSENPSTMSSNDMMERSLPLSESDDLAPWHPAHALVALPTMLRWANACVATTQVVYYSFYSDKDDADGASDELAGDIVKSGPANGEPFKEAASAASGPLGALAARAQQVSLACSSGGASSASGRLTTRGEGVGFEMLLPPAASATSTAGTESNTALLPLHMLLLLMRNCSEEQDSSEAVPDGGESSSANLEEAATEAASDLLDVSLTDEDVTSTRSGPSWNLVRKVELADRAILLEYQELLRQDEEMKDRIGRGNSPGASDIEGLGGYGELHPLASRESCDSPPLRDATSGSSIMRRLNPATKRRLQQVCQVIIGVYEQLTGTGCIIKEEQLIDRSRGALLVFTAAIMRYYTSWYAHPRQQLAPTSIKHKRATLRGSVMMLHDGVKHSQYPDWSHPPHSHRDWLSLVQRQAQWIALSFSALHDAIRIATRPVNALSMLEHERVEKLIQQISLTELSDLLSPSTDMKTRNYIEVIAIIEQYTTSLHLVFHQYALPLVKLRAGNPNATNVPSKDDNTDKQVDFDNDAYITGNTLWCLLCRVGLAGKSPHPSWVSSMRGASSASMPLAHSSPPLPVTLHRPAVFSLIEEVTQGTVAVAKARLQHEAMMSGRDVNPGARRQGYPSDQATARSKVSRAHVISVSRQSRTTPCYARALREDPHIDLRADAGAVCMNFVQFIKVLIRVAHAWQCQQLQQQKRESMEGEMQCRLTMSRKALKSAAGNARGGPGDSTHSGTSPGFENTLGSFSPAPIPSQSTVQQPQQHDVNDLPGDHIQYEGVDHTFPICTPYFDTFLGGLFLPPLIGANRWISAQQRAFLSKPVLELLGQHHDDLKKVFDKYQEPYESRGVRAALPPPYSTLLAPRFLRKMSEIDRGTIDPLLGTLENYSEPPHHSLQSNVRDVGIVSVLRWKDVQAMAKELEWYTKTRISEKVLQHCFDHVVADPAREGAVLFFSEFLQLLCAISSYASPDPTVPLETKLLLFLNTRVFLLTL